MSVIKIQITQWADIPYMGSPEMKYFSAKDAECFKDIRDVLVKHGALNRFGMFLIHRHFEVAEDEEMTECTEHRDRRLTIQPKKKANIDPNVTVPTNWIFTEAAEVATACCTCARNDQGHQGYHR